MNPDLQALVPYLWGAILIVGGMLLLLGVLKLLYVVFEPEGFESAGVLELLLLSTAWLRDITVALVKNATFAAIWCLENLLGWSVWLLAIIANGSLWTAITGINAAIWGVEFLLNGTMAIGETEFLKRPTENLISCLTLGIGIPAGLMQIDGGHLEYTRRFWSIAPAKACEAPKPMGPASLDLR